MSEQIAIVTGANKGLGFAIAKGLCKKFDGITYLTSRDENRGLEACEKLKKLNYKPQFRQLDVSDKESIKKFSEYIKNKHQGIDVLVNNAGILFLQDAQEPIEYQKEQTVLINFFALLNFTEDILPLMKNNSRIINISSSSGHLSRIPSEDLRKRFINPNLTLDELTELVTSYLEAIRQNKDIENGWGGNPYVISKVAMNAYTFILHRRLQDRGILVNCVHPGYVKSDMTHSRGSITPEEGAVTPLKLALETSTGGQFFWNNGTVVPWDGPDPRGYVDGRKDL